MELPDPVAVIGAGTMGPGIAKLFGDAGSSVRLAARRQASLDAARERLGRTPVTVTTDVDEALAGAELVVETISEDAPAKHALLARAEALAAQDAVLVTNTSSLSLAGLARALERPGRFAGLHFFNPPELVELVEIVGGEHTSPETLAALESWMVQVGKAPIVVRRDVPGFVGNRLQYALLREAYALVEDGVCSAADVDRAVTHGLGARWAAIGPFETMDLAGLEVHAAVVANLFPHLDCAAETPAMLRRAVEGGTPLRGDASREELIPRRDRVLRGLRALRDGNS